MTRRNMGFTTPKHLPCIRYCTQNISRYENVYQTFGNIIEILIFFIQNSFEQNRIKIYSYFLKEKNVLI